MIFHKKKDLIIRSMNESDIDLLINNFTEQGWPKPKGVLERYLARQNNNELYVFIAEHKNDIAGYTVLYPNAENGPFANKSIPEIQDFIVFIKYQKKGIGNSILDEAEKKAAALSNLVTLSVGLHYGYGAAQRIYIKRGYMPDGTGVWYNNIQLEQYADCKNGDELVLFLSKKLPSK